MGFKYETKISPRKKREGYFFYDEVIILKGHGLKLTLDTETNMWCGNACFNFIGEELEVKKFLEENALYPIPNKLKAICTISNQQGLDGWNETPL